MPGIEEGQEQGIVSLLLNGYGILFWRGGNILELDRSVGCIVSVLNATESFTLKWMISCNVYFTSIIFLSKIYDSLMISPLGKNKTEKGGRNKGCCNLH